MRQAIVASLAAIFVVGGLSRAPAQGIDAMVYYMRCGYHRNVDWPWPYICPDRVAAREPFNIMIQNGWRRQNLLGAHHFGPEGNGLTTAGELKIRWIMTQAPPAHRQIFVERSTEAVITAERVATARDYAARVSLDGRTPVVAETHLLSEGRPAATVDAVNVRFQESMMPPVLPPPGGGSSLQQ